MILKSPVVPYSFPLLSLLTPFKPLQAEAASCITHLSFHSIPCLLSHNDPSAAKKEGGWMVKNDGQDGQEG